MKKTIIFIRIVTVLLLFFTLLTGVALIFVHDEAMKLMQYTHYLVIVIPMFLFIPLTIFHFYQATKVKKSENGLKENGGKTYLAKCGHTARQKDKVEAFGETIYTEVPLIDGGIEYCHECLAKMAVKCAWCGEPIFIGDIITLYSPVRKDFKVPDGSAVYEQEPLTLVGCKRITCAESGADYCGRWMPPGKVKRFRSLIETALENPGHAVSSNDIGNTSATKLTPLKKEK